MSCYENKVQLVNRKEMSSPDSLVPLGKQLDGSGSYYSVVAHTEWGDIPGKGQLPDRCWFPYGGKEHETCNFSFLEGEVSLCLAQGCLPPRGALQFGDQTDDPCGYYMAVAVTEHGTIPGKAKGNNCWYPYGGKEYQEKRFFWVVSLQSGRDEEVLLTPPKDGAPPEDAVCVGQQLDSMDKHYTAVANTDWGTIPGKARENTCWFPYGGKEHLTENFQYVCWPKDALYMELGGSCDTRRPALKRCCQTDCMGTHYCALAITEWGTIPGKAKGTECWYSYGWKEYSTEHFYWLCI